jgi:serine/threonine-protein kinase
MKIPRPLEAGTVVAGRFRVLRKIAEGAMGEVWAGEHVELALPVAAKVLKPEALQNEEIVARFSREAFLLGRIHSHHVARLLDFTTEGRHGPILVMELIDGPSLAETLRAKRLSVEETIALGIDITSALRELHGANVVHRDVKPANILMKPLSGGRRHRAVFVDLGVSRQVDAESSTDDGLTEITTFDRAVGTIEYMSPEQIISSRDVTPAADLYALGTILFRAVSGRHVFPDARGMDLARVKLGADAPPLETGRTDRIALGLAACVARALARSPHDRYQAADGMLADLRALRDAAHDEAHGRTRSIRLPASSGGPHVTSWSRRLGAGLAVLAAGAVLGAARPSPASEGQAERPPTTAASPDHDGRCIVTTRRVGADAGETGPWRMAIEVACGDDSVEDFNP